MWTTSKCSRSVLYVSCASCAKSSGTGSGWGERHLDRSGGIAVERRTAIAKEHALDLLQVLADLFAGLGDPYISHPSFNMDHAGGGGKGGTHLFPWLTWRGGFEFKDVVSQAAHEIGWCALL